MYAVCFTCAPSLNLLYTRVTALLSSLRSSSRLSLYSLRSRARGAAARCGPPDSRVRRGGGARNAESVLSLT